MIIGRTLTAMALALVVLPGAGSARPARPVRAAAPAVMPHVAGLAEFVDGVVAQQIATREVAGAIVTVVYQGRVPPLNSQFQTMPVHDPRSVFLDRLRSGFYRFAAVSNMVEDYVDLDPRTRAILKKWPVLWSSEEHGTGPSRLIIYRSPGRTRPILLGR